MKDVKIREDPAFLKKKSSIKGEATEEEKKNEDQQLSKEDSEAGSDENDNTEKTLDPNKLVSKASIVAEADDDDP